MKGIHQVCFAKSTSASTTKFWFLTTAQIPTLLLSESWSKESFLRTIVLPISSSLVISKDWFPAINLHLPNERDFQIGFLSIVPSAHWPENSLPRSFHLVSGHFRWRRRGGNLSNFGGEKLTWERGWGGKSISFASPASQRWFYSYWIFENECFGGFGADFPTTTIMTKRHVKFPSSSSPSFFLRKRHLLYSPPTSGEKSQQQQIGE